MAVRKRLAIACAFAILTFVPATASPQPVEWVEGLSEFTAAAAGMYGDDGARIGPALDKMAEGLAEWDRAIQTFEARLALELHGGSAHTVFEMRVSLAGMYIRRGRLDAALAELDAAIDIEPQRADPRLLRGLVLDASGRSTEAGEAFRAAWTLDASDPIKAYYVLRHKGTRDVQAAREALAAAYLRLLENAARTKASPFMSLDRLPDRAAETPVLAPAAYANGYTRLAHGEYKEAIAEFREAAARDPMVADPAGAREDSSETHRRLGLTYWMDAQDDKSIEHLEIAIRRNPLDERSRVALARVLSSAGRDSDAERALQETTQVLPGSVLAHWWLGRGYERVNRFLDARREYEIAASGTVAGRSWLYASIGRLARDAADFPAAAEAFAHWVAASPNDPMVHKQLAGVFLRQDRADEAFAELVATLLVDPLDAGAHAGIGQLHLNAGRYDEARTALARAVQLSPSYTEARYALATALTRLGNTQEAAREFERVEQEQRQRLADRRRTISIDVLKEEEALRAVEGKR
jgi:tetratricopeptide (TPR) repeat protein